MIVLDGVAVSVDRTPVLEGLDLELAPRNVLGVTGPNGSGKTTFLHLCATLRPPRRGTGTVLGADLLRPVPAHVRRRICLVEQRPSLHVRLTLRENLRFVAALYGRPARVADQALDTVGLARASGQRLDQCSQGMSRRADLARALVIDPSLLLLDEAHTGLDAAALELVDHLVEGVLRRGGSVVMVSHDLDKLSERADQALRLEAGRPVRASRTT